MTKNLDYYMGLDYPIETFIIPDSEGGGIFARIPLLPGCMTDGETIDEAYEDIKTVKRLWIEDCLERNIVIPEPCHNRNKEDLTDDEIRQIAENILRVELGADAAERYAELCKEEGYRQAQAAVNSALAKRNFLPRHAAIRPSTYASA